MYPFSRRKLDDSGAVSKISTVTLNIKVPEKNQCIHAGLWLPEQ